MIFQKLNGAGLLNTITVLSTNVSGWKLANKYTTMNDGLSIEIRGPRYIEREMDRILREHKMSALMESQWMPMTSSQSYRRTPQPPPARVPSVAPSQGRYEPQLHRGYARHNKNIAWNPFEILMALFVLFLVCMLLRLARFIDESYKSG